MGRVLGAFAGTVAWAGWLAICPALGLPTLSGAAMLNRVLAPRDDPGALLGWALLLIGLASAALVYWLATDRSRWRASIASGLAYGLICWLVAGAVVMPLLGLLGPAAQSAPGAAPPPPDPMQGSFMMLHLGLAAPAAALVAWLIFGAVLGGSAGLRADDAEWRRTLTIATGAALVVLAAVVVIANLRARPVVAPPTSPQTLATGPVEALPPGAVFVSVLELPQAPGATLGPHAHVAGFAYTLKGVATLQFGDSNSIRLGPGEGGFMGTQVAHAHGNAEGVVPAAVLALLIPAAAAAFCIAQGAPGRSARFAPALLAVLVAVAAVGAWNPWSNDWLFISVRPAAARGAGMPLPTASRVYESPDLAALPPGPYVETLEVITVGPGEAPFVVNSTGATVLLVLDGTVWRESAAGSSRVELRGPILAESGSSVRLISPGGGQAHVLAFSVSPAPREAIAAELDVPANTFDVVVGEAG